MVLHRDATTFRPPQRSSPNGLVNKVRKVDAIPPCFAKIVQRESQLLAGWGVRKQAMTDHELPPIENRPRCPRCMAFSRLTHSILDSRHGYTVRLFRCGACGEYLWDDGPSLLAKGHRDLGYSRRNRNGGFCPVDPAPIQSEKSRNCRGTYVINPEAHDLAIHELAAKHPALEVE